MLEMNTMPVTGATSGANGVGGMQTVATNTIVNAFQKAQGVQNLSNGVVYDLYTIPTSFTATITSNAATGGATTTVYLFNTSVLNAAVTTNGSGASSIATTYGDGFSGRVYDNYFRSANAGRGIKFTGFTIIATGYTSGTQTSTPLNTLSMNLIAANGQGSTIPIPFDLSEAIRNTQYQAGTLTIEKEFYINALAQFSMSLPVDTKLTFTFFTEASSFKG